LTGEVVVTRRANWTAMYCELDGGFVQK
jgi:hypothetical protein